MPSGTVISLGDCLENVDGAGHGKYRAGRPVDLESADDGEWHFGLGLVLMPR